MQKVHLKKIRRFNGYVSTRLLENPDEENGSASADPEGGETVKDSEDAEPVDEEPLEL